MNTKEVSESDQFWDWLFEESKRCYTHNFENWLHTKLSEWAKLPIHHCGCRTVKLVSTDYSYRYNLITTKTVCAHCGEVLKITDNRKELTERLVKLKQDVKQLEKALSYEVKK